MKISSNIRVQLETMQVNGIRWMIWNNIEEDRIKERLLEITKQSSIQDLKKFVNTQSRETLIKLIEKSNEITTDIVNEAYEKYRYGLKPGFTLFWARSGKVSAISSKRIKDELERFISQINFADDANYKGLKFKSISEFSDTYEITMSYLQKFNYTNENEEFSYIYMMKQCFVWVSVANHYIAINNMPDRLANIIKLFFSKLYNAEITNITISKKLLDKVFSNGNTKRISKQNSNPPENQLAKISVSDANLSGKMEYFPEGYENYEITGTQYNEDIDDNTTGTLSVNCNKGKLSISKNLTSTQFRNWSIHRINDIIGYFQNLSDISLGTIEELNMFTSPTWKDIKPSALPLLNKIAYAIINCKKLNLDTIQIDFEVFDICKSFDSHFIQVIETNCETCEENVISSCCKCGKSIFSITKKDNPKVICQYCGDTQEGTFTFNCEKGHINYFDGINDIIRLYAQKDFCKRMFNTISLSYPDLRFSETESFSITKNAITITDTTLFEPINPSDISEFASICNWNLKKDIADLEEMYKNINEKCTQPGNINCANCKYGKSTTNKKVGCLLKLFEQFEGFTPQPHQGHEFGDVSMIVTLKNHKYVLCGMAKSLGDTQTRKITKSSQKGRELIQQVIDGFHDAKANIIAVIYPDILDSKLKYLLCYEAKINNKFFLLLDHDFMLKILDKYLDENGE